MHYKIMAKQLEQFYETPIYTSTTTYENEYELKEINRKEEQMRSQESLLSSALPSTPSMESKQNQSSWSKPLLFNTVLLCLILILLLGIAGWLAYDSYHATDVDRSTTINANNCSANVNEWDDRVAQIVYDKLNLTAWADDVVSNGNSNVALDFHDWATGIVFNITGSLPDFNEWANGVVSKVNSNVTGSLPDFNEWANGVSQNVFHLLLQNYSNFTEHFSLVENILHTTKVSAQRLINIVNTLSNIQGTSTSTAGAVDEMLLIAHELLSLHNGSNPLPTSCQQLKGQYPDSLSGYYVLTGNGMTYTAYCDMDVLCGSGGGWTRLAYLDMDDATQNCPSGFKLYQSGGVRACGRTNSGAGCVSVSFPSNNLNYSQICGRVKGYQYRSTDAIENPSNSYRSNINSYYVDGVSVTRGSPRQHVWTLMSGYREDSSGSSSCPCNTYSTISVQSFIGSNYFCESANYGSHESYLRIADPLWDGQECVSRESPCCSASGIPWFHRNYGNTIITDNLELRVCGDESISNEDSPVSYYEIYVK